MSAAKGNGPDAPHDQPAKTFTKNTTDFIATAETIALALIVSLIVAQTILMLDL